MAKKNYWLMKSEPDVFGFDDLMSEPGRTSCWDGVRNYQARNFMRDGMKKGDGVLFYHSNCPEPGVYGVARVVSEEAYPDHTQFDKRSRYYDPKSDPDNPRWFMVDIKGEKRLKQPVTLQEMKEVPALRDMKALQKGNRLSITPVSEKEWKKILEMGGVEP